MVFVSLTLRCFMTVVGGIDPIWQGQGFIWGKQGPDRHPLNISSYFITKISLNVKGTSEDDVDSLHI